MKYILLCLFSLLISIISHARKYSYYPPKAILVQLKTEQRKINALESNDNDQRKEQIKNDIARVQQVMINDFRDNFSYCPVYYFYDSDLEKVKAHNLQGVLMDETGNMVAPLTDSDTSFYVAYYGMSATYTEGKNGKEYHLNNTNDALVLLSHDFRQISVFKYSKIFSERNDYSYESKYSTTIAYKNYAGKLDKFLRKKLSK